MFVAGEYAKKQEAGGEVSTYNRKSKVGHLSEISDESEINVQ